MSTASSFLCDDELAYVTAIEFSPDGIEAQVTIDHQGRSVAKPRFLGGSLRISGETVCVYRAADNSLYCNVFWKTVTAVNGEQVAVGSSKKRSDVFAIALWFSSGTLVLKLGSPELASAVVKAMRFCAPNARMHPGVLTFIRPSRVLPKQFSPSRQQRDAPPAAAGDRLNAEEPESFSRARSRGLVESLIERYGGPADQRSSSRALPQSVATTPLAPSASNSPAASRCPKRELRRPPRNARSADA